jgi:membrane-associated phospholipid phosphatase
MGLGIVILFLFISRPAALAVAFAGVAIGALGFVVKYLVARPRPNPQMVHVMNPKLDDGKYSYMAGHVGSYVAVLGFLAFLVYGVPGDPWWRLPLLIVFGSVIILIGLARVYSGEHWFSDVIGGYLLGSICLVLTIRFYEWAVHYFA